MVGRIKQAAKRNGHSAQREILMRLCQSFCYEADVKQARAIAKAVAAEFAAMAPPSAGGMTPAAELALEFLHMAMASHAEQHNGVKAVRYRVWRQYCYAGDVSKSDVIDSKRTALWRASNALQNAGLIVRNGLWVWPT
jgi:hypothetical protein